jgi:hypothetical protein
MRVGDQTWKQFVELINAVSENEYFIWRLRNKSECACKAHAVVEMDRLLEKLYAGT